MKKILLRMAPAVLGLAASAPALDLNDLDLRVGGYVDGGRFQLSHSDNDGEVLSRMGAKWFLNEEINDRWSVMAKIHWMFWRNQGTDLAAFHIAGLKFDSDLEGRIDYRAGSQLFRFGLYDFKYNPDSRNLGEYLLRSEAYPTIVESAQGKDLLDPSFSRVAGVQYGIRREWFRTTALLYAEQYNTPVNDISTAGFMAAGPAAAELEAGVAWHRFLKWGQPQKDDRLDPALKQYVKDQGLDTKAVKLSLRGRLDFAALAGVPDCKLYGEAALLGLKNDTLYYKHMLERVPMMAGLEVPTFGILTSLSGELEYFPNPYLERKYLRQDANGGSFSPLPFIDSYAAANLPDYRKDDWKWSIFAHKALNNWLDLKVRFASDHLRLLGWNGDYEGGEPMTRTPKNWYFLARVEFHN